MVFATLWDWFRPARPRRGDLHFVLFTRSGCHLCDVAWDQLQEARRRYGFHLETADVDASPDLVARYGHCVPVVTVNGKVRFRGAVNPVLLQRLLDVGPGKHVPPPTLLF